MGFIDRLEDIIDGGVDFFEAPLNLIGDVVTAPFVEDEYEGILGTLVFASKDRFDQAMAGLFGPDKGLGALIGGLPENVREVGNQYLVDPMSEYDAFLRQYVSRPLSTGFTMLSIATNGDKFTGDWERLFDGAAWREAWNLSNVRNDGTAFALFMMQTDIENPESIQQAMASPTGVALSGLFDLGATVFLDPLVAVGKVSKAMRAGKLAVQVTETGVTDIPRILRSSKSNMRVSHALLPESFAGGQILTHVRRGFRVDEENPSIMQQLDNLSTNRMDANRAFQRSLGVLDEVVTYGDEIIQENELYIPGTTKTVSRALEEAAALRQRFPTLTEEQAFILASQSDAAAARLLFEAMHGYGPAMERIVAQSQDFVTRVIGEGEIITEYQRLVSRADDVNTQLREGAKKTRGDFVEEARNMPSGGGFDEAMIQRIADEAEQLHNQRLVELNDELADLKTQINDELGRQAVEGGYNISALAYAWGYKGDLRRNVYSVDSKLDDVGRFDEAAEESIINNLDRIEDATDSIANAEMKAVDAAASQSWLDMASANYVHSLGQQFVENITTKPNGLYELNINGVRATTGSTFDKFVVEPALQRMASDGSSVARTVLKTGQGVGKVMNVFVEKTPQRFVNFNDNNSVVQFRRMLEFAQKDAGGFGALLDDAKIDEYVTLYQLSDVTSRTALFNQVVTELTNTFVNQVADIVIGKDANITVAQRKRMLDRLEETLAGPLRSTNEAIANGKGHMAGTRTRITVEGIDGASLTTSVPLTPAQLQNAAYIPRFDDMKRTVGRLLEEGTAKTLYHSSAQTINGLMDRLNKVWKPTVLLRPAYMLRTLPDELLRSVASIGFLATVAGLRQGRRDLDIAYLNRRTRGPDFEADAFEELLELPETQKLLKDAGIDADQATAFDVWSVYERSDGRNKFNDAVSRAITRADKKIGVLSTGVRAGAAFALAGPLGLAGYTLMSGYNRTNILAARVSRTGSRRASRLANRRTIDAYGARLLDEANNLLEEAIKEADPLKAKQLREAAAQLRGRSARAEDLKKRYEFNGLEMEALTAVDRASEKLHDIGHGHVYMKGVAIQSAFGQTADMQEINANNVSSKRGATNWLYGSSRDMQSVRDNVAAAGRGELDEATAFLYNTTINRDFTGFGLGTTGASRFTNVLWEAPDPQLSAAENAARMRRAQDSLYGEGAAPRWSETRLAEDPVEAYVGLVDDWLNGTADGRQLLAQMPEDFLTSNHWVRGLVDVTNNLVPNHPKLAQVRGRLAAGGQMHYNSEIRPLLRNLSQETKDSLDFDADDVAAISNNGRLKSLNRVVEGKFTGGVTGLVSRLFESIATLPTDNLVRNPHFRAVYDREVQRRLAAVRVDADGFTDLSPNDIYRIEDAARTKALADTRKKMFDLAERTRFGEIVSNVAPFFDAWQEVVQSWVGLAAENPVEVARLYRLWDKSDVFTVEDDQGDKHFVFRIPKLPGAGGLLGEVEGTQLRFRKNALNTIAQGTPGFGPILTVPIAEVVKRQPNLEEVVGFMFPYGFPAGGTAESIAAQFSPTWLNRARQMFDESSQPYLALYDQLYKDELVKLAEVGDVGRLATDREFRREFDEAIHAKTRSLFAVRTIAALFSPAQPYPVSPYDEHITQYRAMQEYERSGVDPEYDADREFLASAGDEFFYLTLRNTVNNTGIAATQGGFEVSQKYKDFISEYPEYGGLIVGAEGNYAPEFSEAVYRFQQNTPIRPGSDEMMREYLSADEFAEEAIIRRGWKGYRDAMDAIDIELDRRGLDSIEESGAYDLREMKQRFLVRYSIQNPQWADVWRDSWNNRQARMPQLRDIAERHPNPHREDIEALRVYLQARRAFEQELFARAAAGRSGNIQADENAELRGAWLLFRDRFGKENLAFTDIYMRYFDNDIPDIDTWSDDLRIAYADLVR